MKYLDKIRVTSRRYEDMGIKKDDSGIIMQSEIQRNMFQILFTQGRNEPILANIHVADMELVQDRGMADEDILEDLPRHDPSWWCKVENGYIMNLRGEKKNKVAYDYDS